MTCIIFVTVIVTVTMISVSMVIAVSMSVVSVSVNGRCCVNNTGEIDNTRFVVEFSEHQIAAFIFERFLHLAIIVCFVTKGDGIRWTVLAARNKIAKFGWICCLWL